MYDESALFIEMPVIVKARQDGNRRLVEVEASNEAEDSEGDVILQQALLGSADSFVKSGHLDIDHLSEIGDRLGIQNPSDYIVGTPLEVKDLGGGRTGVVGELHKTGRHKADELWESLKADPPVRWRASIYGFPLPGQVIDCRVTKAENTYGASRFLVKGLDWRSLAFTRNPINTSIKGNAQIVTAKSYLAVMKSRMSGVPSLGGIGLDVAQFHSPNFIMPPRTPEELKGHFLYHIAKGNCPCVSNTSGYSSARFQKHFEICCGDSSFDAAIKAGAMMDLLRKDRRVSFYPFTPEMNIEAGAVIATVPAATKRLSVDMQKSDELSLVEKIVALVKGHSHGGAPDASKIEGIKVVEDIFNEPGGEHSAPSRSEIVTGPAERSSGGGASPMVNRYSDFAPQAGLTALYERVDGLFRDFAKANETITALRGQLSKQERAMSALIGVVGDIGKAVKPAQPAVKAEGEAEGDTFLGKAEGKIVKAKRLLRKAEMEEDEKGHEERKSDLSAVLETLKSALRLLAKADEEGEDEEKMEKSVAAAKALQDKVKKGIETIEAAIKAEADAAAKAAEEAAKAEAEAAAKAAEEAAKAAEATSKSSEETTKEEKDDDTAKAAAAKAEQVEKALVGLGLEVTTVKGMIETLMAGSRSAVMPPPSFMKSEADGPSIAERIDEARDTGSLTEGEGIIAQSLMQRQALVKAGRIPADQVERDIAAAPPAVRDIFRVAA